MELELAEHDQHPGARRRQPAAPRTVAEVLAREASRGFAALGDAINPADALRVVGSALTVQGRCSAAADALGVAPTLARARNSVLHEAEALRALAELHAMEENYPVAAVRALSACSSSSVRPRRSNDSRAGSARCRWGHPIHIIPLSN